MQCTEHYWFVFQIFTCDPGQRDPNNDQRLDFTKLGCYKFYPPYTNLVLEIGKEDLGSDKRLRSFYLILASFYFSASAISSNKYGNSALSLSFLSQVASSSEWRFHCTLHIRILRFRVTRWEVSKILVGYSA